MEEHPVFLQMLKYDVGQIELLAEIYSENMILCSQVWQNRELVSEMINLIRREGRKCRYLL